MAQLTGKKLLFTHWPRRGRTPTELAIVACHGNITCVWLEAEFVYPAVVLDAFAQSDAPSGQGVDRTGSR